MKKKKIISIKYYVLVPVILLGAISIIANFASTFSLFRVTSTTKQLLDEDIAVENLLTEVNTGAETIHKLVLSHIIAEDFDSMIEVVSEIKEIEAKIERNLNIYEQLLTEGEAEQFQSLKQNYTMFEQSVNNLTAYSASAQTTRAFSYANGEVLENSIAMQNDVDTAIEKIRIKIEDSKEEFKNVYTGSAILNGITLFFIVVIIVGLHVSIQSKVLKPILDSQKQIKEIVDSIESGNGDLTKRIAVKHDDEIGQLGNGINVFLNKLQSIFLMLREDSVKMDQAATQIHENILNSTESIGELSAVTEELSATMQEVGTSSMLINEHANGVHQMVAQFAEQSTQINAYSEQMKQRADDLESKARKTMDETNDKLVGMLSVLDKSISDSKSVEQVSALTNDILDISSQTNLLALNASIEAARAGDAGKGFAVVAQEISMLAASSRETANRIQEVNNVVTTAVDSLANNAKQMAKYLHDSVLPEFENFVQTGETYKEDADYVEKEMSHFTKKSNEIEQVIAEMVSSIHSITTSIEEGVNAINGAAENTQELVGEFENIKVKMDESQEITRELMGEASIFKNL